MSSMILALVAGLTGASLAASRPDNGAVFVSQTPPPATMSPGQTATVTVKMRNTGKKAWTAAGGYKLGAQSPTDNSSWRKGRVRLPSTATIRTGELATFTFPVTAPSLAGSYGFQWRMVQERKQWFGQLTPKVQVGVAGLAAGRRHGKVRLVGWHAEDDDGPFNAVGFTFMSGVRLYRDKSLNAQLDKDLDAAAAAGYHFARILGEVGWADGRSIDPSWPDYDAALTGYIKHAWEKGIRTQLCIFGGSEWSTSKSNRKAFVDRVIRLVAPLQEAIMYMQIVNEPGVIREEFYDLPEMIRYADAIQAAMPGVIVTLGAPPGGEEEKFKAAGFPTSPHLDRSFTGTRWRPVRQPWDVSDYLGKWSNDEPIGPGSSVNEDRDCERQKSMHMMTFIGKGFATVFHSVAGVYAVPGKGYSSGQVADMPCFKDIPAAVRLLPKTLPQYTRKNGNWADAPFKNLDAFEPSANQRGALRVYSGISGDDFATMVLYVPVGIKFQCRTVTGPVSVYKAETLALSDTVECAPGKTFNLGPGSRLMRRPITAASPN